MQTTTENDAPVRPVTEEPTPCEVCDEPVDLRRLCAIWPNGRVAHASCYKTARLSSRGLDRHAVAGEICGAA